MENKNTQSGKITKKGNFTREELNEIERAMEEEGYSHYPAFVMNMVRTRRERSDAKQRRKQRFNYHHANLLTLHNMLMANIEPRDTTKKIMMEVDSLCRDLV